MISSVANDVAYKVYEYGSQQTTETYKYTTTSKGVTLYIGGYNQMLPADTSLVNDGGLSYIGQYESEQEAYEALIEISGFRTTDNHWTGMGIDQEYIFYGGQTDAEATDIDDLPYRVTSKGVVNGKDFKIDGVTIDNVRDVKVNGSSVVTNKQANIDLTNYATKTDVNAKQDILIEGTNITIGSDGKTISATDTTYNDFAGSTHGLVPPVQTQAGKFLKDDGTWADATGASAVEDLTDVDLDDLADGQILKYNSTSEKWENADESGGEEETTWAEYRAMTPEQQKSREWFIPDYPDEDICEYDATNESILFHYGASYFSDTETIRMR